MNEEEIIKTVDKFVDDERLVDKKGNYYKPYKFGQAQRFVFKEQYEAIQGLLDLYIQEKEKNKKLEEEWDEALIDAYFKKEEVYNKVIDLMAEEIWRCNAIDCDFKHFKDNICKDEQDTGNKQICKECIKQYHFKKAGDRS